MLNISEEHLKYLTEYASKNEYILSYNQKNECVYFNKFYSTTPTYFSFAHLDDQKGPQYHVEYRETGGYPSYENLIKLVTDLLEDDFIREIETEYFISNNYKFLVQNGYHVYFHDKYYHFVCSFHYTSFELESKQMKGGRFYWKDENGVEIYNCNYVYNISETGDHMYLGGLTSNYFIKCDIPDCICKED